MTGDLGVRPVPTPLPGTAPGAVVPATRSRTVSGALTAAVVLALVGSFLGDKIVGRFAWSNVVQLVSLALLLWACPYAVRARDVLVIVLGVASALGAGLAMSLVYGYTMQPLYLAFFTVAVLTVVVVCRAVSVDVEAVRAFDRGVRIGCVLSLVLVLGRLVVELPERGSRQGLGFDDKSHAAVACCALAFVALRFLRDRVRLALAGAFLVAAFMTGSRLTFVFVPFFLVAFVVEYRRVRRHATTPWQVYLAHLALGTATLVPVAILWQARDSLTSFVRLTGLREGLDDQVRAHLLLLQYAAEVKVENVANLLLGITPGGFAGVTARSDVDTSGLAAIDPVGFQGLAEGTTPMHSATMSVLVELPFWVAVLAVALLVTVVRRLVVRRETVVLALVGALVVATTFYSSHNEAYFWALWAVVGAVAARPPTGRAEAVP